MTEAYARIQRARFIHKLVLADPDQTIHGHNYDYWYDIYLGGIVLLFPDLSREQHHAQEFVFAVPCRKHEWHKLYQQAERINQPQDGVASPFLPYYKTREDDEEIIIILRSPVNTDEQCLSTAAYLRMVDEFTGMIYSLPYSETDAMNSIADIIRRTAGVPPHQVRHIEVK
jgi:hypothetical protein